MLKIGVWNISQKKVDFFGEISKDVRNNVKSVT
jgi:hypothetical protein